MIIADLDKIYEEDGVSPEKRLAVMEAHQSVINRDDVIAREVNLEIFAGKPDAAIKLLQSRFFRAWEGGGRLRWATRGSTPTWSAAINIWQANSTRRRWPTSRLHCRSRPTCGGDRRRSQPPRRRSSIGSATHIRRWGTRPKRAAPGAKRQPCRRTLRGIHDRVSLRTPATSVTEAWAAYPRACMWRRLRSTTARWRWRRSARRTAPISYFSS